jgi:hypothetical protein
LASCTGQRTTVVPYVTDKQVAGRPPLCQSSGALGATGGLITQASVGVDKTSISVRPFLL